MSFTLFPFEIPHRSEVSSTSTNKFQIIPDIPEPSKPTPQVTALEKLFIDIAGEDMEVDWMELQRILDHSMREGWLVNRLSFLFSVQKFISM